ncbi:Hsp70 family protein [Actinomycetospora endophytica]|uniref:Hsp70 family protein n=1 Tax=Actinomycetospora endophytica TaxID=2291215 RepID=A0ABS8PEK4_9PSEU|nr:Hsp70 family protein [Actinomycetospora endophytica]MCD2196696.1 Hsp70 family protein [Actinomycetospora endophytica]
MAHVLGVDLGGTTVAAAVAGDDGRPEMVALGDRSIIVPAVVHHRDGGSLVTGEVAARRATTDPSRAAWGVRRRLGDPAPVLLGEETRPATDLLAAILRDVLVRVATVRGETARRVVLTHPAGWGPFRRGLFEDVAAAAGLPDAAMITDAQAAAGQQRALHGFDDGSVVAVYDLGGSSFEASVLTRRGDALEPVGSPVDIERLGGTDFDEAVIALVDESSGGLLADLDPDDDASAAVLARLRQDCLVAKEALSSEDEVNVPVLLPGRHAEVSVSRAAFEERIRPTVTRSVEALGRALEAAPVRPGAVLLIGGSARVPLVERTVADRLGLRVIVDDHPEYMVALGAARAAAELAGADAPAGEAAAGSSPARGKARAKGRSKPKVETAAAAASSSADAESSAPTTVTPRPVVDGRVAAVSQDDVQTTVTRPGSPADDTKTTVTRPEPGDAQTTVTRASSPADETKTAVVRPSPGTGPQPRTGGPSTRPSGEQSAPRQQPARPGMPSGSFPAVGRPAPGQGPAPGVPMPGPGAQRPGGQGPGGQASCGQGPGGQGPGRRPGPPGGRPPAGPPGAPQRPMTGPFPGAGGPGTGPPAQAPAPSPTEAPSGGRSSRTVLLVVAAVIVLLVLVGGALLATGVL